MNLICNLPAKGDTDDYFWQTQKEKQNGTP